MANGLFAFEREVHIQIIHKGILQPITDFKSRMIKITTCLDIEQNFYTANIKL